MCFRKYNDHQIELTTLRFVNSQSVSQLQRSITLLPKVTAIEAVSEALLRCKLDRKVFRITAGLPLPDSHTDFTVGQVTQRTFLRIDFPTITPVIAEIDHLVSIDDALNT
ncbi:hypothetical protein D3C84_739770 [compost metagenome]